MASLTGEQDGEHDAGRQQQLQVPGPVCRLQRFAAQTSEQSAVVADVTADVRVVRCRRLVLHGGSLVRPGAVRGDEQSPNLQR